MLRSRTICCLLAFLLCGGLALSGCGSPKPRKSASSQIGDAEGALRRAAELKDQKEYDLALEQLKNAESAIKAGREIASAGPELSKLRRLSDQVSDERSSVTTLKITDRPKPKAEVAAAGAGLDPAEAKAKAEADAKKKTDETAAKAKAEAEKRLTAAMNVETPKKKPASDDDDGGAAPAATPAGGDAAGAPGAAAAKSKGPFPPVSPNSPPLEVVKIDTKGKFALAYIQLYNKSENGKRIMGCTIYFKDKDNALVVPEQSVCVFPYNTFNKDKKDLTDQDGGLTMGSQSIDGASGLQLIAVAETERIALVKKAGVLVSYDDGTRETIVGPSNPDAAPMDKGLLLK